MSTPYPTHSYLTDQASESTSTVTLSQFVSVVFFLPSIIFIAYFPLLTRFPGKY